MTDAIQRRKGTTAEHATFIGLEAEVTIDTTKDTAIVHDGETAGGIPLAREDLTNSPAFAGATAEAAGVKGLVPAPEEGVTESVLYSDGTWSPVRVTNVAIISATTDPDNAIGNDGQYWMNTATHFMFGPKADGVWPAGFSVIGPQGIQGIQGIQGLTGIPGNTVMYGNGNPSPVDGVNDNFYINTVNWSIFGPKANGEWPAGVSLIGPQGEVGPQGIQGERGEVGLGMPAGGAPNDFLQKATDEDHEFYWSRELKNPVLTGYTETIVNHGGVAGDVTVDFADGSIHRMTLTGDITLSAEGVVAGKVNTMTIIIENIEGYNVTPFTGSKWPGGFVPDFDVMGTSVYGFTTYDNGATWLAITSGQGFA